MAKDRDEIIAESVQLTIADLVAALKASSGNDDESMQRRAMFEAEARKRLDEVENKTHPGISVYSYPEGDRAHPKEPLKCAMYWVGYEEQVETLTPLEIDYLNRARPGSYSFTRMDGSRETLDITPKHTLDGRLESLSFQFACKGDKRHNLPSKVQMLKEVFGPGPMVYDEPEEVVALRAELARTQAALVAAQRL